MTVGTEPGALRTPLATQPWGVLPSIDMTSAQSRGDRLALPHRHGRRHEYSYVAAGLFDDRPISELHLRDVSFSWARKKPGTMSGKVSVPALPSVRAFFNATVPGRTVVYVMRDGVPVWGGIIWKRSFGSDSRELTIEADTFDSYMYHRVLDQDVLFYRDPAGAEWSQFAGTEQIEMFRILWRLMSEADYGDLGVILGSQTSPVTRGRRFSKWDFKTYGEHLETLANLSDGFDWFATVGTNPTTGRIERRIEFAHPNLGRAWRESGLVWEYPANALSYSWDADADKAATVAYVLGAGEGDLRAYATRENAEAMEAGWPRLDVTYSHTSVVQQSTMQAHAMKYLRALAPPVTDFSLSIHPHLPPAFGEYFLGDEVRIVIDDDLFASANVRTDDLIIRIEEIAVAPNDVGLENVSPTVSVVSRLTEIVDPEEAGDDLVPDNWPGPVIPTPGPSGNPVLAQTWHRPVLMAHPGRIRAHGDWLASKP